MAGPAGNPDHRSCPAEPVGGPIGLYIHIPFCEAICHYCNFNRGLLDAGLKGQYLSALSREIEAFRDASPVDSIFFGGGTPSVLAPEDVAHLVSRCRASFEVLADTEITVEVNPETALYERLLGYRSAGVNRLSIGVQSFRDEELRRLGRLHTAERAIAAVETARRAGFVDLSVDLMAWLPGQTVSHWCETVDTVIDLAPEHVSVYMLELYPNAPLRDEMARGGWALAPDDVAAEMYHTGFDRLEAAGYRQYEISNVAKPGRRCRHNLKYWSDGAWVGFGCGAHSTRAGYRWTNLADRGEYVSCLFDGGSPVVGRHALSPDERISEALFLGLRLTDGVDVTRIERRYNVEVWRRWGDELTRCVEAGLLHPERSRLRLTRRGQLLASEVMQVFV